MNHVCTPIPDSGEKRIIKTISKEVTVTSVWRDTMMILLVYNLLFIV
jgi:hypothetical protein